MSASHELLYAKQDELTDVDLSVFIKDLVRSQESMVIDGREEIKFVFEMERVMVNVSAAISIGMIISECISNAVKHAFEDCISPKITIQLKKNVDRATLSISDNGNGGIIQKENIEKRSLGLRLIRIFAKKINGENNSQLDMSDCYCQYNPMLKTMTIKINWHVNNCSDM